MVKQAQISPRIFSGIMEDFFGNNVNRLFRDDNINHDGWLKSTFQVPVNIKEDEAAYIMDLLTPGIAKEDLKLSINDKTLAVSFESKEETKENIKWLRKEFKPQSFKRTFALNDKVDTEKISATLINGILQLVLPKKEAAIAVNKTIEIQ